MAENCKAERKVLSPRQAAHEKRWNNLSNLIALSAKKHGKKTKPYLGMQN